MPEPSQLQITVSNLALGAPLVPILAGGIRYARLSAAQRRMWGLLVTFIALSGLNFWLRKPGANLLPLYHLYTLVEFAGYLLVFSTRPGCSLGKQQARILFGLFLVGYTLWLIAGGSIFQLPTVPRTISSILIVAVVVAFFVRTFVRMEVLHLEKEFLFWLSLALLIIFLGNLLLEIFGQEVFARMDVFLDVWTIKNLRELIAYPLIAIGMLCLDPQVKS